jgi:hypothetical protein
MHVRRIRHQTCRASAAAFCAGVAPLTSEFDATFDALADFRKSLDELRKIGFVLMSQL